MFRVSHVSSTVEALFLGNFVKWCLSTCTSGLKFRILKRIVDLEHFGTLPFQPLASIWFTSGSSRPACRMPSSSQLKATVTIGTLLRPLEDYIWKLCSLLESLLNFAAFLIIFVSSSLSAKFSGPSLCDFHRDFDVYPLPDLAFKLFKPEVGDSNSFAKAFFAKLQQQRPHLLAHYLPYGRTLHGLIWKYFKYK